jgi:hypothetical protein
MFLKWRSPINRTSSMNPVIEAKTIRLIRPRVASDQSEVSVTLISRENMLRRSAYRNTSINTDESFFDDSDMQSEYSLLVVYDVNTSEVLLTARYYTYLKSDFPDDDVFLIDRMSANISSQVYRQYRNRIHVLFYLELLRHNRNRRIMAMARSTKDDKLLKKYLGIGLEVVGKRMHQGQEHWILLGDAENYFRPTSWKRLLHAMARHENIPVE